METLITSFSSALGWSLIHSLWQGAGIYLIVYGIYLIMPDIKASTKHALASTAQGTIFFGFAFTFFNLFDLQSQSIDRGLSPTEDVIVYYLNHLQENPFNMQQYFVYIVPIYIFGLLIQALICTKDYYQIRRLKKSAIETNLSEWKDSFQLYIEKLGIKRKVSLMISEFIEVPVAIGYFKPIVLLPISYVNQIPLAQAQALILHELSHIKRNDYLRNLIKVCIETILFFNPFIWLLSKHIHTEREQACDDMVTSILPNYLPYAKALLTAELLKQSQPPKWSLAATGHNHKLLSRIKRITNIKMETAYTTTKHQLFTILLVTGTLISLAWIQPKPIENLNGAVSKKISTQIEHNFEEAIFATSDTIKPISSVKVKINQDTVKAIKEIHQEFESEDVANQIFDIQKYTDKIQARFEGPEWEAYVAKLTENALAVGEKFNSPEWHAKIAQIEENARKVEEKFNSPEWKAKIAQIEENARKVEEKFNSPEWKAKIAQIEENARKVEEKFNSPEWKAKINKLEEKARKFEKQDN